MEHTVITLIYSLYCKGKDTKLSKIFHVYSRSLNLCIAITSLSKPDILVTCTSMSIVFTYLFADSVKGHLCCWEGIMVLPGFMFHSKFKMKLGSIMIIYFSSHLSIQNKISDPRIFNMTISMYDTNHRFLNTGSFLVLHSLNILAILRQGNPDK